MFNREGKLRVAFFCRETFGNILLNDENMIRIAEVNDMEIHLLSLGDGFSNLIRGDIADHFLLMHNNLVRNLYEYSFRYIQENDIKISLFFGSGFLWIESFLTELKQVSYVACYFADDPEGAEETSRYYVKNFHYAFCGGIFFDETKRIEDKYKEWGARKSKFIPLGACPVKYKAHLEGYSKRDVEVVYVGGAYLKKILRIFKLKKHFGLRMQLYGRDWNYSGRNILKFCIARLVKGYFKIPEISELPADQLVDLYQRAKIGFNMHMSFGPSNQRLYELPMNGVMQICDCEHGLNEIYEIGKEVVVYRTIDEAIEKIKYYLEHDEERKRIAEAGYNRAKNDYLLEHSFGKIKNKIISDIHNNYLSKYPIVD